MWVKKLAREAQLQRGQQAESGMQLRNVRGEMHGADYNQFMHFMQLQ